MWSYLLLLFFSSVEAIEHLPKFILDRVSVEIVKVVEMRQVTYVPCLRSLFLVAVLLLADTCGTSTQSTKTATKRYSNDIFA